MTTKADSADKLTHLAETSPEFGTAHRLELALIACSLYRDHIAEEATDKCAPEGHIYLSTACLHNEHDYCSSLLRDDGSPKMPAECKFCQARCICECHLQGTTVTWNEAADAALDAVIAEKETAAPFRAREAGNQAFSVRWDDEGDEPDIDAIRLDLALTRGKLADAQSERTLLAVNYDRLRMALCGPCRENTCPDHKPAMTLVVDHRRNR